MRVLIWKAEQKILLFENKVIYAVHWQSCDTDLWTFKACYLKGVGGQYVHNHLAGETCVSSTAETWAGSDRIKIDLSEIDSKAWMWEELA
jgi:hypothetical protein